MDGISAPKSFFAARSRKNGRGGFTISEVVIAGSILALFIVGALVALTQLNRYATAIRLRTLALAVAQQRIDEALTAPWQILTSRPDVLAVGTKEESNIPLNNDSFNDASGLSSAFTALDTPVSAKRTTTVSDLSTRLARITVVVTFDYRKSRSEVKLTTLRTTDNF